MFPILQKRKLAENTYLIEIEAHEIAKKAKKYGKPDAARAIVNDIINQASGKV